MTSRNDLQQEYLEEMSQNRIGEAAQLTQGFIEAHCKLGNQYETSFFLPSLAPSTSVHIIVEVGAEPLDIQDLFLEFDSDLLSATLYRDPVYSGTGTTLPVFNMSDSTAIPSDVVLRTGITPTDNGTQVSPKQYTLGSVSGVIIKRAENSLTLNVGVERVLAANTNYVYVITNEDPVNAARVAGLATWYQGPLDLPKP